MERKSAANQTLPAGAAEHTQNNCLESHPRPLNFVLREYAALVSILAIIRNITRFIRASIRFPHENGGTLKSMLQRKAVDPAEALKTIKLMNVSRTTALFLLIMHLFRVTTNV